jgi:hypothetical protein
MSRPTQTEDVEDPIPNPEPSVPSLKNPDPEVFHREPTPLQPASKE